MLLRRNCFNARAGYRCSEEAFTALAFPLHAIKKTFRLDELDNRFGCDAYPSPDYRRLAQSSPARSLRSEQGVCQRQAQLAICCKMSQFLAPGDDDQIPSSNDMRSRRKASANASWAVVSFRRRRRPQLPSNVIPITYKPRTQLAVYSGARPDRESFTVPEPTANTQNRRSCGKSGPWTRG